MVEIRGSCHRCNRDTKSIFTSVDEFDGLTCRICRQETEGRKAYKVYLYVNGFFHKKLFTNLNSRFLKEAIYDGSDYQTVTYELKEQWLNDTSECRIIGELNNPDIIKDRETGMLIMKEQRNLPSYVKYAPAVEEIEDRFEILDL